MADVAQIPLDQSIARFGTDPVTFEVVGPVADADWLASVNTLEQIEKRRLTFLLIENSDDYYQANPKTPEQLKGEADAEYAVGHPETIDQKRARLKPEEQAELDQAIASVLNPSPPKEEEGVKQNPPGVVEAPAPTTTIDTDP